MLSDAGGRGRGDTAFASTRQDSAILARASSAHIAHWSWRRCRRFRTGLSHMRNAAAALAEGVDHAHGDRPELVLLDHGVSLFRF